MPEPLSPGYSVIFALFALIVASIWLGTLAQRRIEKKSFLSGFFLGNRGLGAWTMALTATVQSGGTFMGFPALVYSHGWAVALWIGGYMVVPLTGFAVVGKRLAQISRRSGAITVPDLFRERFNSPQAGLVASLLILIFMSSMMIAQFKAGALVMKLAWPDDGPLALTETFADETEAQSPPAQTDADGASVTKSEATRKKSNGPDWKYFAGLGLFATTVVGYTLVGGFLASVWTDLFQSVMMVVGVGILLLLALPAAGGLENATHRAIEQTGPGFAFAPGYQATSAPDETPRQFITPGLAVSFFFIWVMAGVGSPASMVRVMATESTEVIRKSVFLLSIYNCLIYIPLIVVFISARAIIDPTHLNSADEVVPHLALKLTHTLPGGGFLAGLILAAPFGAVMATVSCYLLVIASGLVKDIYLRFIRPQASMTEVRRLTRLAMVVVGLIAIGANIRPVEYLQALVVFSGASAAATFVVPALMLCYWRRATAAGALAAMLAGAGGMLGLFAAGWLQRLLSAAAAEGTLTGLSASLYQLLGPDPKIGIAAQFGPYLLYGLDPILWSLLLSVVAGVVVSYLTHPPEPERVAKFFDPPAAIVHDDLAPQTA